jgi:hypothetical protein
MERLMTNTIKLKNSGIDLAVSTYLEHRAAHGY